jgi:hypothetical protein
MSRQLRIFLACQQSAQRHTVPAYAFWAEYFRGAFAEAGHVCIEAPECDWAEGLLPRPADDAAAWRERTWTAALAFLRREHARQPIDFLLSYLFPSQVAPGAVAEIRALGIPCVNFFCDNVREFRCVPEVYRIFDLHWVPEHKAVALYRRAGLPLVHAPMPCWVPQARRAPVVHETLPVTFIGTRDEQRERLFAEAIQLGFQVDLRGPGWESAATIPAPAPPRASNPLELLRRQHAFARQHGWPALIRKHARALRPLPPLAFDFSPYAQSALFGDAYWNVLRESKICLGVNRYPSLRFPFDQPDSYSRLRDIEAPMAGACYLTEWTAGLEQLYDPGVEIETYCDAAELVAKATELAADAPRRARLRAAGQRRALGTHSIPRTLDQIAARLGCAR